MPLAIAKVLYFYALVWYNGSIITGDRHGYNR